MLNVSGVRKRRKLNLSAAEEQHDDIIEACHRIPDATRDIVYVDTFDPRILKGSSESSSSETTSCSSSSHSTSSESESDNSASENDSSASDSDEDLQMPPNIALSKIVSSNVLGPDSLNLPLHPNLSVSKFEVLLMILHLSMRHRMTDVFLEHLFSFVDQIVGVENSLGTSKYLFKKLFQFGRKPVFHFFCPKCIIYLGIEDSFSSGSVVCPTEDCDWEASVSSHNDGNFFLTLSIKDQLIDTLNKPGLKFVSRNRLDGVVSDVMDGEEYRSLFQPGGSLSQHEHPLTLTINTDGSPVFKSGPNSLWPVHFYINEIDPSQRFSPDNIMLAGLWFSKTDAKLKMFMEPIVAELKELQKSGVVWRQPCGSLIESPVFVICCVCDSVARPKMQSHQQFNGHFGCSFCLHPNSSIEVMELVRNSAAFKKNKSKNKSGRQKKKDLNRGERVDDVDTYQVKRILRYRNGNYGMRTNKSLREHMKLASVSERPHLYGSTGLSIMCKFKHFNVVHGFALDYMHALLLGTMKRLANLWLDSTSSKEAYYIGLSIDRLNMRLADITLPSGFRTPRSLSDRAHWKANEWRAFLLYFALPVLVNILPGPFYDHFKMFASAVYTLSQDNILQDEIADAACLLNCFVCQYQDLYGVQNMVFNVHITRHMADAVKKMGPLWAFSAFPFESANGRLVKLCMGTKGVTTQICRKYVMTKSVPKLLLNNYRASENVLKFCCDTIGLKYLKNYIRGKNSETMLGRQIIHELTDTQKQACIDKGLSITSAHCASRVVVGGKLFHARKTTRQKRACDSCVRLSSGQYALIDVIFTHNYNQIQGEGDVYLLVTKLNIALDPSPLLVPHIKQCSLDPFGDVELITSVDITKKCIFYNCSQKCFVAEITNFYETD